MNISTIKDKFGYKWVVKIDEQSIKGGLPLTATHFRVFPPTGVWKKSARPVAHINVSVYAEDKTVAKIVDWDVIPKFRNRGIGSVLLDVMESWARNRGVKKLTGDVKSTDANHINKLSHIYQQHDYTFKLNTGEKKGASGFVGRIEKSV
ncbi:MAG: GNAT family N-acetyltransferase [Dehalococcoidales bacterium]|nr:GNAT family N-acetyltransferase [Dehalococcoidales bacterium]